MNYIQKRFWSIQWIMSMVYFLHLNELCSCRFCSLQSIMSNLYWTIAIRTQKIFIGPIWLANPPPSYRVQHIFLHIWLSFSRPWSALSMLIKWQYQIRAKWWRQVLHEDKVKEKLAMSRLITYIIEYTMKCQPKSSIVIETSIMSQGKYKFYRGSGIWKWFLDKANLWFNPPPSFG
jgi:hypothetical protein